MNFGVNKLLFCGKEEGNGEPQESGEETPGFPGDRGMALAFIRGPGVRVE